MTDIDVSKIGDRLHLVNLLVFASDNGDGTHEVGRGDASHYADKIIEAGYARVGFALADVAAERSTHHERGYTAEHDDELGVDGVVKEAVLRAWDASFHTGPGSASRRVGLVKAAALLLAAIDAFDRTEADCG